MLTHSDVGVDGAGDPYHNPQTQQQGSPIPVLVLDLALGQLFACLRSRQMRQ